MRYGKDGYVCIIYCKHCMLGLRKGEKRAEENGRIIERGGERGKKDIVAGKQAGESGEGLACQFLESYVTMQYDMHVQSPVGYGYWMNTTITQKMQLVKLMVNIAVSVTNNMNTT